MRSTTEARREFGRRLADLREQSGVTQRWIAQELADRGHEVRTQAVSGWERGAFAPDRAKAQALDELMGAKGVLLDALGYSVREASLEEELAALKAEFAEIKAELAAERKRGERLERELRSTFKREWDAWIADQAAS